MCSGNFPFHRFLNIVLSFSLLSNIFSSFFWPSNNAVSFSCVSNITSSVFRVSDIALSFSWVPNFLLVSSSASSISWITVWYKNYRQTSNIRHQIPKLKCFLFRLAFVFVQSIEAKCWVENEDVGLVGAAPAGGATFEWPSILIPTKMRLILEVLR